MGKGFHDNSWNKIAFWGLIFIIVIASALISRKVIQMIPSGSKESAKEALKKKGRKTAKAPRRKNNRISALDNNLLEQIEQEEKILSKKDASLKKEKGPHGKNFSKGELSQASSLTAKVRDYSLSGKDIPLIAGKNTRKKGSLGKQEGRKRYGGAQAQIAQGNNSIEKSNKSLDGDRFSSNTLSRQAKTGTSLNSYSSGLGTGGEEKVNISASSSPEEKDPIDEFEQGPALPPVISSVNPKILYRSDKNKIVLEGQNFQKGATIFVGEREVPTRIHQTQSILVAEIPEKLLTAQNYNLVTVVNPDAQIDTFEADFIIEDHKPVYSRYFYDIKGYINNLPTGGNDKALKAFDDEGRVIGVSSVKADGTFPIMHLYMDDPQTEEKEGLEYQEAIKFMVGDYSVAMSSGKEYTCNPAFDRLTHLELSVVVSYNN